MDPGTPKNDSISEFAFPSLGNFGVLPLEIRDIIWSMLIPQKQPISNLDSGASSKLEILRNVRRKMWNAILLCRRGAKDRSLAIMRASPAIYQEFASVLYHHESITFKITPHFEREKWICVSDTKGNQWELEDIQDGKFSCLSYHRLKSIQIDIEAPGLGYGFEGDLTCLRQKVLDIIDVLLKPQGIRHIKIHLVNTQHSFWLSNGAPRKVITRDLISRELEKWQKPLPDNCRSILLPFCQLANVKSATVLIDSDVEQIQYHTLGFRYATAIMSQRRNAINISSISAMQRELDETHLAFQQFLDYVSGPSANMLRLRRCAQWYKDTNALNNHESTEFSRTQNRLMSESDDLTVKLHAESLLDRWKFVHAMNPMSGRMMRLRMHVRTTPQLWKYGFYQQWDAEEWYILRGRISNSAEKTLGDKGIFRKDEIEEITAKVDEIDRELTALRDTMRLWKYKGEHRKMSKKPKKHEQRSELGLSQRSRLLELRKLRKHLAENLIAIRFETGGKFQALLQEEEDKFFIGVSKDTWDKDMWYQFYPYGLECTFGFPVELDKMVDRTKWSIFTHDAMVKLENTRRDFFPELLEVSKDEPTSRLPFTEPTSTSTWYKEDYYYNCSTALEFTCQQEINEGNDW